MSDWFASWFDTKYYHLLYGDRNDVEAQAFINNLIEVMNLSSDQYLLDLCCGKGRHSRYLNTSGFEVKGVDLSPSSIDFAKKFENERLTFDMHDMRDQMPGEKFDVVLNLFTSFGYFDNKEDNQKVFKSVYSYLNQGGIFLIDFLNVHKVIANLNPHEIKRCGDIDFQIGKKVEDGFIVKTIDFVDDKSFHFEEKVAALDFEFFEISMRNEGFEIMDVYGSYELDRYDKFDSDRLIIKAIKK
ncbi:MAG: SAM-dependent methyltransferase [Arenicella sp.]|jgi:SAM-dependent methyltransferase